MLSCSTRQIKKIEGILEFLFEKNEIITGVFGKVGLLKALFLNHCY